MQLMPLPARLARRVSPIAHEVYATGALVAPGPCGRSRGRLAGAGRRPIAGDARPGGDPALAGGGGRLPGDLLDRLALRRPAGPALLGLGERGGGFLLNAALGIVQISGQAEGLFGFLLPDMPPAWAPSLDDLLESPSPASLRRLEPIARLDRPAIERVALVPDRPFLFGTMMGGPGALLALGSMALPLALAILLHVLAPRGSRESLGDRLRHSGLGGLAVLMVTLLWSGAFLAGLMAGPWFCLPFAVAVALVGLPSAARPEGAGRRSA